MDCDIKKVERIVPPHFISLHIYIYIYLFIFIYLFGYTHPFAGRVTLETYLQYKMCTHFKEVK
jgi:hypothetical protein